MLEISLDHYSSRRDRARFIAANFKGCFHGRVLDVGCGDSFLSKYVAQYTGIDITGQPNARVDLERGGLPFSDGAFDTVVCTDVLEHVEPLASVLREIFRVGRRYVIVSLPNVYALGWRLRFLQGHVLSKEYSLTPRNRHKWLPSLTESRVFLKGCLPEGWHVVQEFGYTPRAWWRRGFAHTLLAHAFPNLLATGYWVLFEYREP